MPGFSGFNMPKLNIKPRRLVRTTVVFETTDVSDAEAVALVKDMLAKMVGVDDIDNIVFRSCTNPEVVG